jgi:hypothetical protein
MRLGAAHEKEKEQRKAAESEAKVATNLVWKVQQKMI